MKVVALIPARSGSKRIKNKNFKDFLGKPIVEYPIDLLNDVDIFDDIVLYTDQISFKYDVTIMHREIADDHQTTSEMLSRFLYQYPHDVDYLCLVYPTSVFLKKGDIMCGLQYMQAGVDCVATVCEYPHPIERAFVLDGGYMYMIDEDSMTKRTQDCDKCYYDAGQMYFINVKAFKEQGRIFMDMTKPIIVNAVDIDNIKDWERAEVFYDRSR